MRVTKINNFRCNKTDVKNDQKFNGGGRGLQKAEVSRPKKSKELVPAEKSSDKTDLKNDQKFNGGSRGDDGEDCGEDISQIEIDPMKPQISGVEGTSKKKFV